MKCHYEVLNVARNANLEEIKKAYKKLAIKWHPDKNLNNTEAATEQFQLIQQAFEVLSDPHERTWYDDHRDAILKGKVRGECEDDCLDVYQYFTASCYKGFGDDEKGFYSVYREVFNKIVAEDSEYCADGDSDVETPSFGTSTSSPEDVKSFYAHWQSYCTKKSYSWLDPFDTRQAENRKISRLIDKENKKVRDKARKARNEEVRELVNFVRKRDKRVQVYAQQVQKLNAEKARKNESLRVEKMKQRKTELESHKESEWAKFSNLEKELRDIETNLASEFGECASDDSLDEYIDDNLYCIACNKLFKTAKAFQNHESSKKHKEKVLVLKQDMLEDTGSEHETDNETSGEEGEILYEYDGVVEDDDEDDPLFCDPCGKQFKTLKAIEDHKKTKKHLDNYKMYKEAMGELLGYEYEEELINKKSLNNINPGNEPKGIFKAFSGNDKEGDKKFDGDDVSERICSQIDEFTKDNSVIKEDVDNVCKKLEDLFDGVELNDLENEISSDEFIEGILNSFKDELESRKQSENVLQSDEDDFFTDSRKKQKKKQKVKSKLQVNKKRNKLISASKIDSSEVNPNETEGETSSISQDSVVDINSSSKEKNSSKNKKKKQTIDGAEDLNLTCAVCKTVFPSKNKLFLHLSKTGHSIYINEKEKLLTKIKGENSELGTNKKSKSKKGSK